MEQVTLRPACCSEGSKRVAVVTNAEGALPMSAGQSPVVLSFPRLVGFLAPSRDASQPGVVSEVPSRREKS